jgi:hypothetical protein
LYAAPSDPFLFISISVVIVMVQAVFKMGHQVTWRFREYLRSSDQRYISPQIVKTHLEPFQEVVQMFGRQIPMRMSRGEY